MRKDESSSIASDVTKADPKLVNLLDKLKHLEESTASVEVSPSDCPLVTPNTVAETVSENDMVEFALLEQIASRLSVIEAKLMMSTLGILNFGALENKCSIIMYLCLQTPHQEATLKNQICLPLSKTSILIVQAF